MKLLYFEVKKYFTVGLLICLLIGISIVSLVYVVSQEIIDRQAIMPSFEIDVVDNDSSFELDMLINMLNNQEGINDVVQLVKNPADRAKTRLESGQTPAYIVVPQNFVEDIKIGRNSPFTLVGSAKQPLQLTLTNILAQAGISFLLSSQSGIYASFDFAFQNGLSNEDANDKLLYPINIAFAMKLLNYKDFINENILWQTGNIPPDYHYIVSFAFFFLLIISIIFVNNLDFNKNQFTLYKVAGFGLLKQILLKFFGFFLFVCLLSSPLIFIFSWKWFFVSLVLSGFIVAVFSVFKAVSACFFIILSAFFMLFVSGGIIPIVYLPGIFESLRFGSLNYWILELYSSNFPILILLVLTVCFVGLSFLALKYTKLKG